MTTEEFINKFTRRFKFFYKSNIFFRDIHYTIVHDTPQRGQSRNYSTTEAQAAEMVKQLMQANIIEEVSNGTYRVIDERFLTANMLQKETA